MTSSSLEVNGSLNNGHRLHFAQGNGYYFSIIGLEAWSSPGTYTATLNLRYADGTETSMTTTFEVATTDFRVEQIYVPPDQIQLLDPVVVNSEKEQLNDLARPTSPEKRWRQVFLVPTEGEISSPFGERRSYNGGPPDGYHEGVDIAAPQGAAVIAANSGIVVWAGPMKVRGNAVVIDHGLGVYSGYFHLDQVLVQPSQSVERGLAIATVGQTGLSTGPHLHWETKIGGTNVDPLVWTEREIP